MPLFNLAYVNPTHINGKALAFFWDGGASDLESQVVGPITNPIEMHETLAGVVYKLNRHPQYPGLFHKAFGKDSITIKQVMQAIAQFERTIVSGSSKYDQFLYHVNENNEAIEYDSSLLTPQELRGYYAFLSEKKGDCFHCHIPESPFITDFTFRNNGTQSNDPGLMMITNNPADKGKFKVPSLRNLVFTAPYMHNGTKQTLEDVLDFYTSGINRTGENLDASLSKHPNGLDLTSQDKADIIAFLKTMTDSSFIQNQDYTKP
jgi:cytochrome c peroxidase